MTNLKLKTKQTKAGTNFLVPALYKINIIIYSIAGLHSDLSLSSLDGDEGETLRRGALAAACADAVAAYATLEGSRVRDSIAAHARRALERERQIDEKNEIIADLSSKVKYSILQSQVKDSKV